MTSLKTIIMRLATLALTCSAVLLSPFSASASIVHRYEREINGSGTPAGSFEPYSVAVDNTCHFADLSGGACTSLDPSNGDVYISDYSKGVVDKFSSTGVYQNQLKGPTGSGFGNPGGLTVDQSNGNVYVADKSQNVVDKFSPAGTYICQITGAGSASTSSSECDSSEPGVPGGAFTQPVAVAVDQSTGAVYVALRDFEGVVDKFNSLGGYVSQLTNDPNGAFIYPGGVAVDDTCFLLELSGSACTTFDPSNGDVYMDDARGIVDKFDASDGYLSQLQATQGRSVLTVDQSSGDLYTVNEAGGGPSEGGIEEFDSSGVLQSEINGSALPAGANLFKPTSVAVDASTGDVYIADRGNHVVEVFGPNLKGPEAFTGGVGNLQPTSATLDGEVNPQGNDTTSFFEYGACVTSTCSSSDPYGSKTATIPAEDGSGTAKIPVEASLSGLAPNQAYHYQLIAANDVNQSPSGGEREFATPAVPPQVEIVPPSVVGFEAAVLVGSVNPEHSETTYQFEYGPCETASTCATSPYTNKIPTAKSSVYGVVDVSREVTELRPSSVYHYRLMAINSAGTATVSGPAEATFETTAAPLLVVESGAASGLTQTAAVIAGTVNPSGLAVSYGFEIGIEAGIYGPMIGSGRIGGGAYEAKAVTLALTGLQPGMTYHYRLVASTAYATLTGEDRTFTTIGVPPSFAQPLTPPLLASPAIAFPVEVKVKKLTKAQQMARALKACARKPRRQRVACRRHARRKFE